LIRGADPDARTIIVVCGGFVRPESSMNREVQVRQQTMLGFGGTPLVVRSFGMPDRNRRGVLLVHGWAESAAYWDEIAAMLGREHLVIVPALRMQGESLLQGDEPVEASIPLIVKDMEVILTELGMADCLAVGHSMGGQVVTLLAERDAFLVASTIVLDPAYGALPDEIAAADTRKREHVTSAVARFTEQHPEVSVETVRNYGGALAALYDSEYLLDDSMGAVEKTGVVLRRRRRPALAVYASDVGAQTEQRLTADAAVPPEIVRWTLGGGHHFPAAHPRAIAELIEEWMARTPLGL